MEQKNFIKPNDQQKVARKLKLMICSPSNAGCDEIVRRLCRKKDWSVVRVGVNTSIHTDSDEMNFNNLVKKKFQELLNKELCKKSSSLKEQHHTFQTRESLFRKRLRDLKTASVPDSATVNLKFIKYIYFRFNLHKN